jgi:hypothetical protein
LVLPTGLFLKIWCVLSFYLKSCNKAYLRVVDFSLYNLFDDLW